MFDTKKIRLNHIKSFNKNDKRVTDFFETTSEILIEKIYDDNRDFKSKNILEIAARNDILRKKIYSYNLKTNYYQTCLSKKILVNNNKRVVSNLNDLVFQQNTFDFCFSLLSLNSSDNISLVFKNIFNILKADGIFVSTFPSDECFIEFKSYFTEFFKLKKNYNFNPLFDMQTLGNLCSSVGFKNVIVDKEKFQFNILKPEDIWNFIRYIGESNYLLNRKKFIIKKSLFNKFYNNYKKEIEKGNFSKNNLSIYYLIGKK